MGKKLKTQKKNNLTKIKRDPVPPEPVPLPTLPVLDWRPVRQRDAPTASARAPALFWHKQRPNARYCWLVK
jgi:hypothetical protein